MKVLVGCEESQEVCKAFRALGHEAYSCDLVECSGGHPEWHIQDDVLNVVEREHWDLGIFHPPCKFLAWSGERWLKNNPSRLKERIKAMEFFMRLYNSNIESIAVENSLSWFIRRTWRWEDQLIHPFNFGDPYHKSTLLWLKNLPLLKFTSDLTWGEHAVHKMWQTKDKDRAKLRAKTYPGIAKAMAEQWSDYLLNPKVDVPENKVLTLF